MLCVRFRPLRGMYVGPVRAQPGEGLRRHPRPRARGRDRGRVRPGGGRQPRLGRRATPAWPSACARRPSTSGPTTRCAAASCASTARTAWTSSTPPCAAPGRTDIKIPILMPDEVSRRQIFEVRGQEAQAGLRHRGLHAVRASARPASRAATSSSPSPPPTASPCARARPRSRTPTSPPPSTTSSRESRDQAAIDHMTAARPRRVPQPAAAARQRGGDPARDRSPARGADGLSAAGARGPRLASAILVAVSVLAFGGALLDVRAAARLPVRPRVDGRHDAAPRAPAARGPAALRAAVAGLRGLRLSAAPARAGRRWPRPCSASTTRPAAASRSWGTSWPWAPPTRSCARRACRARWPWAGSPSPRPPSRRRAPGTTSCASTASGWASSPLGLWAAWRARASTPAAVMAGVLLAASLFAKQTAAPFIGIAVLALFLAHRRRGLILAVTTTVVTGITILLLQRATGGWFWRYVFGLHQRHDFDNWLGFGLAPLRVVLLLGPALVLVPLALRRGGPAPAARSSGVRRPAPGRARHLRGGDGGDHSRRGPALGLRERVHPRHVLRRRSCSRVAAARMRGTARGRRRARAARALRRRPRRAGSCGRPTGCGRGPGSRFPLGYDPRALVPTAADRRAGDALVARLRATPGEVFVPFHPFYALRAGKAPSLHAQNLADINAIPDLGTPRELIEAIRARAFALDRARRGGARGRRRKRRPWASSRAWPGTTRSPSASTAPG